MQIEWLGIAAAACGVLTWIIGGGFPAYTLFISTLFGAGAALIIPSLGYSNIQPAHLMLGFLTIYSVCRPEQLEQIGKALRFPNEGFWLLLTAVYAALSAILLPSFFSGATYVYTIARTAIGAGILAVPLGPTSSNITQTVYFLGDLVCFLIFYAYSSSTSGLRWMLRAGLACCSANLGFAALDLLTYFTGTSELMTFIRNANYQMWDDTVVVGFKRIVGSFPEASTFAATTVGLFAFSLKLFMLEVNTKLKGSLSFLSLCALLFATSSTGYVATTVLLAIVFIGSLFKVLIGPVTWMTMISVVTVPLIIGSLGTAIALNEGAQSVISDLGSTMVVNKLASSSGQERTRWNEQALRNFSDTFGLGAGVGSVRASSVPVAVLGSIGVFGSLTYGIFILSLLFRRKERFTDPVGVKIQSAARTACLAQILAACVAGGFIDLGLQFFIFAGFACSGPSRHDVQDQARQAPGSASLGLSRRRLQDIDLGCNTTKRTSELR